MNPRAKTASISQISRSTAKLAKIKKRIRRMQATWGTKRKASLKLFRKPLNFYQRN
jgi:hypothetical protein